MATARYAPATATSPGREKGGNVNVSEDPFADRNAVRDQHSADHRRRPPPKQRQAGVIQRWTPTALLLSYFVFSIALYTIFDDYTRQVFWFLYLVLATLVAGATALEAYDGLTPLREARNSIAKADGGGWKFKTADEALPPLHLIFDLDDDEVPEDFQTGTRLADELAYPADKITINVLRKSQERVTSASMDFVGYDKPSSARILTGPSHAATSLAARVAYCLAVDAPSPASSITAVFSGRERPHPHAVRHAVERLVSDAKVDIVQGRSIWVPQGGRFSFIGMLSSLEHDMLSALIRPGRSVTWGLSFPNPSGAYWRTEVLRAAAAAASLAPSDGMDLSFAAVGRNARTAYDLKAISYVPCPRTLGEYWHTQVRLARQFAVATVRYTTLAFKRHKADPQQPATKWSLKKRFAVLYTLPIMRLVSHAVVQYFCMAWAILFTSAPTSTADFARTIYFPYPISEWLIIVGLICLIATVGMLYKARSELVPLWTAPLTLVLYPLLLVCGAVVDLYGQALAVAM